MPRAFDLSALRRALFAELRLPHDADLAVAYSGGCDSHVLLHALAALRDEDESLRGLRLTALHFDHASAAESAQWARQCAAVCREWGIAFAQHRAAASPRGGESWEARARAMRYRWFAQVLTRGQTLLTAHHADDQAETVLLNLLRGGGVAALGGIAPLRSLSASESAADSAARVARPLLTFSRAALEAYARGCGLVWIDDPSNQSLAHDRNFLRHSVLPLLRQRWPGAAASLAAAADNCRAAADCIDAAIAPQLRRCQRPEQRGVFCLAPPLDVDALAQLGGFERIALLRAWLHRCGLRSPSSAQLETLLQQAIDADRARASLRWDDWHLRRFGRRLHLTRQLDERLGAGDAVAWDLRARALRRNQLRVELAHPDRDDDACGALLDPAKCRGRSLTLAWRVGGERMTLPGRAHSSAVKKLFQQRAVPPWERAALPLLLLGGEVAWAHGVGAAAATCARGAGGMRVRFVAECAAGGERAVDGERRGA